MAAMTHTWKRFDYIHDAHDVQGFDAHDDDGSICDDENNGFGSNQEAEFILFWIFRKAWR